MAAQRLQRLAVLHRQNIIRLPHHFRRSAQLRQRPAAGSGKGDAPRQLPTQRLRKRRGPQAGRRLPQGVPVRRLRAEAQFVNDAQRIQQPDAARGKPLRGGERRRHRQLQDEVRPAGHRRLGPHRLWQKRRLAPLDEIAAHQADDDRVAPQPLPDEAKLLGVPIVKRVIFTDDGSYFHKNPQKSAKKPRKKAQNFQ